MGGREYTVSFQAVTVAAQQTLFYIKPAADKICVIKSLYLANVGGVTLEGDAKEEFWRIELQRLPATVTAGSVGTAPTPQKVYAGDAAASFTARVNDTTKATTSGTIVQLHSDGMNARVPYVWMPPPEDRHLVANAEAWVAVLNTTPTTAVALNGTLNVTELP